MTKIINNTKGRIKLFSEMPLTSQVDEDTHKCVFMWRNVLDQIITDIIHPTPSREAVSIRRQALYFINETDTETSEDFIAIADLAMFDPPKLRLAIYKYLRWYYKTDNPMEFIQA